MKKPSVIVIIILVISTLLTIIGITGCKKNKNPIKYPMGTFPDSVINIDGLNSQFDDYNSNLYLLEGIIPIIFSSNRGSSGGKFDLVQGKISFQFDQTTGAFDILGEITNDSFYSALLSKANTSGDDLGPYSLFSSADGYEYFIVASQNAGGLLDLYYLKHLPYFGSNIPDVSGPYPVKLLNSVADDAYVSFGSKEDSVYFTSNRDANFDIYFHKRPAGTALDTWFNQDFKASTKVDSVNSSYDDDKCPFVYKNIMVFASDRPGGLGGYDLYYSLFKNGKWNSPVNFGPNINSASDEYRPFLGNHSDFTNNYMVFSSNRPGGKGGFDLYFTGFNFTK
jgi:hypothetical protein